jgi:UDPglucose 6-dehydrogenase
MNISVVGLGKLGLCTAACFAAAGHVVYCYDHDGCIRDEVTAGRCPIAETGLPELLKIARPSLHVVDTYDACVVRSDATLIIVPTPSETDGRFSNASVIRVLEGLSPSLKAKTDFHIVAIVSTVMPGSSEQVFRPLLEQHTGKRCGFDFGLAYNPEFIALGTVIRDFLNPDMVLIGASDERTSQLLQKLYRSTVESKPIIAAMSLVNAEITKISLNCFITMKISFSNALGALCEKVPGADVDSITLALGADRRVGERCLKNGLGFGGPCFPRDNLAFQSFSKEFGDRALLAEAIEEINLRIPGRLQRCIETHLSPPARVALLGVSYKPGTHVIEESQSLLLAKSLLASGYQVGISDPKALDSAGRALEGLADSFVNPYDCVRGADAIILMTDWEEYRSIDWRRVATAAAPGALVLDSWRIARKNDMSSFNYFPLGVGPQTRI